MYTETEQMFELGGSDIGSDFKKEECYETERVVGMVTVNAVGGMPLSIGKRGEHGVTRVAFDLKDFLASCGEGRAQLMAVRPGEDLAYLAVLVREGDTAYWEITGEWTAFCGTGACQLGWIVEEKLAKSEIFSFTVADSLDAGDDVPPAGQQYLQMLQALADRVDQRVGDVGDIEAALDGIIAIQAALMGGDVQ